MFLNKANGLLLLLGSLAAQSLRYSISPWVSSSWATWSLAVSEASVVGRIRWKDRHCLFVGRCCAREKKLCQGAPSVSFTCAFNGEKQCEC